MIFTANVANFEPSSIDPRNVSPATFFGAENALPLSLLQKRRLFGQVVGLRHLSPSDWQSDGIVSKALAHQLPLLPSLALEESLVSPVDGFQKLLLRTKDGFPVETVIIPLLAAGRATLCISSQVGCVMGCRFCATARMTQRRNLETWEMIEQVAIARSLAKERGLTITGTVFMGMGEPFLNYSRVISAAQILSYPSLHSISSKAITISTVGLVDEIRRFTKERHRFRLSISLGAATDEKRARLMPVAARHPVAEVVAAAAEYAKERRTRVNIAYVCIKGENVSENDAIALGELFREIPIRLDLITVTDTSGLYLAPSNEELSAFRDALRVHLRQPVVRRYSGGTDIRAGCGNLAGEPHVFPV